MAFLEFIIIFLISASLFWVWRFWRRLKYDYFFKLTQKAIWKKAKFSNLDVFFAEPFLYQIIKVLLKNKSALLALCEGKYSLAEKYLQKKHKTLLSLALKAHFNPKQALSDLEKFLSSFPQSTEANALLAALYLTQNHLAEAWAILENINLKKCSPFACGIYYFAQTHFCLQEGDLLAASQSCVKAEKYFIKAKASFFLAKNYLLLGTIYRVSFVDDVAELMFRSAGKIFDTLHLPQGKALALANLGMQNTAGEHFDVAEKYFEEAKILLANAQAKEDMAEILNQIGLLHLLSKNFTKAKSSLVAAQKIFKESPKLTGKALNAELFSYFWAAQKNFNKSLAKAKEAENFYRQDENVAARLNCLYLQAEALYAQNLLTDAESVLRNIIQQAKNEASCFHIANAYSLLGLIFLQKGDLRRAKGLFQQSLEQEQKNNRLSGQACDYANIGLLELRIGQTEQAKKHLQAAQDLALELEDKEMSDLLEKELQKLKAQLN